MTTAWAIRYSPKKTLNKAEEKSSRLDLQRLNRIATSCRYWHSTAVCRDSTDIRRYDLLRRRATACKRISGGRALWLRRSTVICPAKQSVPMTRELGLE
jgi:hypothetical protein